MTEILEGFDSRYWDGYLPPYLAKRFKFVGIKASQGKAWEPHDRKTLQYQWARAKDPYGLLRTPFHFWKSPVSWEDPESNGIAQAENFLRTMEKKNGGDLGELKPTVDVEDRWVGMASAKRRALSVYHCLLKTEELWGEVPMIYTATWYWDGWGIHNEFVKLCPEYWKKYKLWEGDPAPDTIISGWGDNTNTTILQVVLDTYMNNFNTKIDLNETTPEKLETVKIGSTSTLPDPKPEPPEQSCANCDDLKEAAEKVVIAAKDLEVALG